MPRLTDHSFLLQHHQLRDQFLDMKQNNFFLLSPTEQWDLFSYFLPHEHASDKQLLEYRAAMSALDASLPQRAGRAHAKLRLLIRRLPIYFEWAKVQPRARKNAPREIYLLSQVHPQLDPAKMAQILLHYKPRDK